jgi:hypothetical protein
MLADKELENRRHNEVTRIAGVHLYNSSCDNRPQSCRFVKSIIVKESIGGIWPHPGQKIKRRRMLHGSAVSNDGCAGNVGSAGGIVAQPHHAPMQLAG